MTWEWAGLNCSTSDFAPRPINTGFLKEIEETGTAEKAVLDFPPQKGEKSQCLCGGWEDRVDMEKPPRGDENIYCNKRRKNASFVDMEKPPRGDEN